VRGRGVAFQAVDPSEEPPQLEEGEGEGEGTDERQEEEGDEQMEVDTEGNKLGEDERQEEEGDEQMKVDTEGNELGEDDRQIEDEELGEEGEEPPIPSAPVVSQPAPFRVSDKARLTRQFLDLEAAVSDEDEDEDDEDEDDGQFTSFLCLRIILIRLCR
jgi:transcription elongation factor SPT5